MSFSTPTLRTAFKSSPSLHEALSLNHPPNSPTRVTRPSAATRSPQDTLAFLVGDIVGVKTSVNQDPLTGNSSYAWQIPGVGSLDTGRINLANLLAQGNLNNALSAIDDLFESEYEEYLGENIAGEKVSVESIRNTLNTIKDETGTNPVIIYAISLPEQLELVLVLPEGPPIRKVISAANATALQQTLTEFRDTVTDRDLPTAYLDSAQRLYSWMIAPVESQLKSLGIDTLNLFHGCRFADDTNGSPPRWQAISGREIQSRLYP
jgi:hypothetical protein